MARPFDATRRRFTGDPQPLVEGVHYNPSLGQTAFSVSLQGTLAYVLNATTRLRLTWVDRNGTITPVSGTQIDADFALSPRLSSDGSRAAFQRGADIWIYDITRDQAIRLTNNASADRFPIWSPDGSQLVFGSNRNTPSGEALYIMSSNGAAGERAVQPGKPGNAMVPRDWARDGESVVLETGGAFGQQRDIGILRLSAGGAPVTYLATPVDERDPALSPDGRWLAYASNESGIHQIVVRTFPDPTVEKITVGSGRFPRWKGDGRELYYIDSKGKMVAASVATSPTFRVISTTPLFDAPYVPDVTNLDIPYDVTHDGRRFLMSMPVGAPSSAGPTAITVVRGWTALLEN
jgi:Tol biopolymer transport system component